MRIIALFNLKPETDPETYEKWAQGHKLPGLRSLASVADFDIYRTTGLLDSTGAAPHDYIEVLDILDREGFDKDMASDTIAALSEELHAFADNIIVMTTERLSVV